MSTDSVSNTTGVILYIHIIMSSLLVLLTSAAKEVCYWETFEASCPVGQVVVMTRAVYGRMRLGRCVEKDLGYLGCHTDVLDLAHAKCSGRQECSIHIPDPDLDSRNPCEAMQSYFEGSFTCQKVETTGGATCRQACDFIRLNGPSGHLSNWITETTGCGSTGCPWLITVDRGQTIRVSLIDFGKYLPNVAYNPSTCKVYAVIRDPSSQKDSATICGGRRDRMEEDGSFVSQGNELEIRILGGPSVDKDDEGQRNYFLLKYEVLGCPEIVAPEDSIADYIDDNLNIRCIKNAREWSLRCNGTNWIGSYGNCTKPGHATGRHFVANDNLFSATSLAIIISVAFVICTLVLVVGLICYRLPLVRCSRNPPHGCHGHEYEDPPDPLHVTQEHGGYHVTYAPRSPDCDNSIDRHAQQTISPEKYRTLYGEKAWKHHYEHICEGPVPKTGYIS